MWPDAHLDGITRSQCLLRPAPDEPSRALELAQTVVRRVGEHLDGRLVRIHPDETGEVVDDEVIHRPASALLSDDHALQPSSASGALTLRAGAVTREHLGDRLPRPGRRDPKSVPRARCHGCVGSDDPDR